MITNYKYFYVYVTVAEKSAGDKNMLVVVARNELGQMVRRVATESHTSARRWQSELLTELEHGTVTIDETESWGNPIRRISTAWIH